jgi:Domain of unknown function (DUF4253)
VTSLPEDEELRIGSVTLPGGRQLTADYGSGEPVAWATIQEVPDPGLVWSALSEAHPETGLVPFILAGLDGDTSRPWDEGEFEDPSDTTELDHLDAATALEAMWTTSLEDPDQEDAEAQAERAPFTRRFPGLAPPEHTPLTPGQLRGVLAALPPARIGLIAAARPADILPQLGWDGAANWHDTPVPIAAVLRSWEHRFGARLLQVGFDEIKLLVERPPHSLDTAQRLAAEHYAFCDESGGQGLHDIPRISASILNAPTWVFWWD